MTATLPNFLIIGAMKAGTTSLWQYVRPHPGVFMTSPKELHFFVEERNWGRGVEWYADHFRGSEGASAVGEASPSYSKHPHFAGVPERIAAVVPGVRLIYIVRDPVQRMISNYVHWRRRGTERASFEDAMLNKPIYLDASRYAFQIERYLEVFDRDQILVVLSEKLRDEREATLGTVFEFLGLEPVASSAQQHEYYRAEKARGYKPVFETLLRVPGVAAASRRLPAWTRPYKIRAVTRPGLIEKPELSPALEAALHDRLRDDVARLRSFMDEDFDGWGIL